MATVTVASVDQGSLVAETDILDRVLHVTLTRKPGIIGTLSAEILDSTGALVDRLVVGALAILPDAVQMPIGKRPLAGDLQVTLAYGAG